MQTTRTYTRRAPLERSLAAEAKFRANLEALGATLLDTEWRGSETSYRVLCSAGHECNPRPSTVAAGRGLCRTCLGMDTATAEARFRNQLAEVGAVLLEERYLGANKPHRIRCALGHENAPTPGSLRRGNGACKTCAGKDTAVAEQAFRNLLAQRAAKLLEPRWLGAKYKHRVACRKGHETVVTPVAYRRAGGGNCVVCIGRDSATAALNFRAAVIEAGGEVLEPFWLGSNKYHRVICSRGHRGKSKPDHIRQGRGLCRICSYRTWDAFYVVASEESVKLGITSGDPKDRLSVHKRDGYTQVVRVLRDLGTEDGLTLERVCRAALADARIRPIRGREYFPLEALPVVLDIVDGWSALPEPKPAPLHSTVVVPRQRSFSQPVLF